MKTSYSLMEIANQLKEVAKANGKDYSAVHIELTNYQNGRVEVDYKLYFDGTTWITGKTPQEAFIKLGNSIKPPEIKQDVELDISEEDEKKLTTYDPDADPCFNN